MTFELEQMDIKELEAKLKFFLKQGLPYATRATLTSAAWDGRSEMQKNIMRKMITRNKWTLGSVRASPARSLNPKKQASAFGSTAKYMVIQEDGGTERGKGSSALSIPTGYSAGQEGSRPRTKLPRKAHKMRNIKLNRIPTKGTSRKQRNFLLVKAAKEQNLKYIFMDLGRRKGVFRVLGTKKKPKIKMVADVSQKSIRIRPRPTLKPAFVTVVKRMDEHYKRAMIFQLRRAGLY